MRKILIFIGVFFWFLSCTQNNEKDNSVSITIETWDHKSADRNGEDYIKLWVNDTLLYSDTYQVDYIDSLPETWYNSRMKVATIPKMNWDSVKIRVRLISLDSVLFAGRYAVDTTFNYRLNNIPCIHIDYYRQLNNFRVVDPVNNPEFFQIE